MTWLSTEVLDRFFDMNSHFTDTNRTFKAVGLK
jgi:hypothetical protein